MSNNVKKESLDPIGWMARERNDNKELANEFAKLHTEIVNKIIKFCKEHNITNADNLHLSADTLIPSVKYGEWCPYTDSCFYLTDKDDNTIVASM